jgi:2-polyprenyl-6-methoxyphenol hydroxylase-like FAD-dependent oxidoreductase
MSMEARHDLLVIGAGPVGLVTALLGARAGLDTVIVDQEWRIAARNYACTLHPYSLDLLDRLGVLPRVLERGVRVDTVAFYEGPDRQAEVHLGALPLRHPFAVVMYQDDLEGLLEDALREHHNIRVDWGRRLEGLAWEGATVTALLERLQHSATGDPAHRWQEIVERRGLVHSRFVAGADGPRSKLRHLLGTGDDRAGDPLTYAIYEFEPVQTDATSEIRIAFDRQTINNLWPLPGGTCRWSLQSFEPGGDDAPDTGHETITPMEAPVGGGGRQRLAQRIQQVAPWFSAGIRHIDWAMRLEFQRRVVHQMGRGGCWLLGDAAHQTAPGGAHSMNVAFREAEDWIDAVRRVVREEASPDLFVHLNTRWRDQWYRLLGLEAAVRPTATASPWVHENAGRLVPCLPASGDHLASLLAQIGVDWS